MNLLPRVLCGAALFLVTAATSSADSWVDTYNRLLGKYVTSGGVKYAEWKGNAADVQALQTVVDAIAKENVSALEKKQQLAFCQARSEVARHTKALLREHDQAFAVIAGS